jgi:hypothetical protein
MGIFEHAIWEQSCPFAIMHEHDEIKINKEIIGYRKFLLIWSIPCPLISYAETHNYLH